MHCQIPGMRVTADTKFKLGSNLKGYVEILVSSPVHFFKTMEKLLGIIVSSASFFVQEENNFFITWQTKQLSEFRYKSLTFSS